MPAWARSGWAGAGASLVAVAFVTGAIELFKEWVPVLSLGVLYVFGVLPIAIGWGLAYAAPVAVASMAAFNRFFLPPLYTFTLADRRNWFALAVYLATAVVVSELASRARRRAAEAEQREREAELLADLATELLRGASPEELNRVGERTAKVLSVSRTRIELGTRDDARSDEAPRTGSRRASQWTHASSGAAAPSTRFKDSGMQSPSIASLFPRPFQVGRASQRRTFRGCSPTLRPKR
jgi:K+-sensing histidine kinase KdpD